MLKSHLVFLVSSFVICQITAQHNNHHGRYRIVSTRSKRAVAEAPLMRQAPGQARTSGLIDKLSEGIAQGLSTGLSTGISSGITSGVYALPDAIAGTLNNLKNPYYGSSSGASYSPVIAHGSPLSPYGAFASPALHTRPYPASYSTAGNGLYSGGNGLYSGGNGLYSGGNGLYSGGNSLYSGGHSLYSGGNGLYSGGNGLYSGGNGLYSGGNSLYSGGHSLYSGGNSYTSGSSPLYSSVAHAAPAYKPVSSPHHWDCKLVRAPYGNKLGGLYKASLEDDTREQVDTLGELIESTGDYAPWSSNQPIEVMRSNNQPMEVMRSGNQPMEIMRYSNQPMEIPRSTNQPMMAFYRGNSPMVMQEMEKRKNMAILEEMNMRVPPLGMIDANKLVYPHDQVGEPRASNADVVVLMVPLADMSHLSQQDSNQGLVPLAESQQNSQQGSGPPQETHTDEKTQHDKNIQSDESVSTKPKASDQQDNNERENFIEENEEDLQTRV